MLKDIHWGSLIVGVIIGAVVIPSVLGMLNARKAASASAGPQ